MAKGRWGWELAVRGCHTVGLLKEATTFTPLVVRAHTDACAKQVPAVILAVQ